MGFFGNEKQIVRNEGNARNTYGEKPRSREKKEGRELTRKLQESVIKYGDRKGKSH